MFLVKRLLIAVATLAAVVAVAVPAASASVVRHAVKPVISVYVSVKGTETTPSPLVKGEVLKLIGGTGRVTVTVLSVSADGPLDKITTSMKLAPDNIYDFRIVSVPVP